MRRLVLVGLLALAACRKPSSDEAHADPPEKAKPSCVAPPATIAGALTIGGDGCTLHVAGLTVPKGATLTVAPGTHLVFDGTAPLQTSGGLVAEGTADAPIAIGGAKEDWKGLRIDAGADASFAHVTIDHAAEVGVANDARASFVDVAVHAALFDTTGAGLGRFESVTLDGNVLVNGDFLEKMASARIAKSLVVLGGVSGKATWPKMAVPIEITDTFEIDDAGALTIAAGNVLAFHADAKLWVRGTLVADHVAFRSDAPTPTAQYWAGITVAAGTGTSITDCTIDDAAMSLGVPIKLERTTFRNVGSSYALATTDPDDCPRLYAPKGNVVVGGSLCPPPPPTPSPGLAAALSASKGAPLPMNPKDAEIKEMILGAGPPSGNMIGGPGAGVGGAGTKGATPPK